MTDTKRDFIHCPEKIIEKFTGRVLLHSDQEKYPLVKSMFTVAMHLTSAEWDLMHARRELVELAEKIKTNVEAEPHDSVMPFLTGEVGSSRIGKIDTLLSKRQGYIEQLHLLSHLHKAIDNQ